MRRAVAGAPHVEALDDRPVFHVAAGAPCSGAAPLPFTPALRRQSAATRSSRFARGYAVPSVAGPVNQSVASSRLRLFVLNHPPPVNRRWVVDHERHSTALRRVMSIGRTVRPGRSVWVTALRRGSKPRPARREPLPAASASARRTRDRRGSGETRLSAGSCGASARSPGW